MHLRIMCADSSIKRADETRLMNQSMKHLSRYNAIEWTRDTHVQTIPGPGLGQEAARVSVGAQMQVEKVDDPDVGARPEADGEPVSRVKLRIILRAVVIVRTVHSSLPGAGTSARR